jgi:S-adenosylmethionine-diacylgycerolhomoserine-N-methlytransferase
MDGVYRYQRHIYDLSRKYFLLGRDRLIEDLRLPPGGAVLEIGSGTGRNLLAAARAYPATMLYGLDVSTEMLRTADAKIRQAGLAGRIVLGEGDAAAFDARRLFGRATFDRVIFSYSLSMIPQWQAALTTAAQLLSPGGRLQVVDFGEQKNLPAWFRRLLFVWLARFHVAPRLDLAEILSAIARSNGGTLQVHAPFRGYAVYAELGPAEVDAVARYTV